MFMWMITSCNDNFYSGFMWLANDNWPPKPLGFFPCYSGFLFFLIGFCFLRLFSCLCNDFRTRANSFPLFILIVVKAILHAFSSSTCTLATTTRHRNTTITTLGTHTKQNALMKGPQCRMMQRVGGTMTEIDRSPASTSLALDASCNYFRRCDQQLNINYSAKI